jgi:hypothetical protein
MQQHNNMQNTLLHKIMTTPSQHHIQHNTTIPQHNTPYNNTILPHHTTKTKRNKKPHLPYLLFGVSAMDGNFVILNENSLKFGLNSTMEKEYFITKRMLWDHISAKTFVFKRKFIIEMLLQ